MLKTEKPHYFSVFSACVCKFFYFLIKSEGADNATFIWCTIICQYQNISQPAANTSSAELCSIATDDMSLSNEL
jgi:hypothetical protein